MQMKQKWYNSVLNELEKCLMAHSVPLNLKIFISNGGCLTIKTTAPMIPHYLYLVLIERPQWVKLQSVPLKTTPDQLCAFDLRFSLSQFARRLRWVCPRQRWWLVHPIWRHRWPPASLLTENHPAPSGVYVCVLNHKSADASLCRKTDSSFDVRRWETRVPGEVTTREYRNSDGTFTVQSDYILVPSKDTHKETLTCVTSYNEEVFTDSVTLDIQCKSVSRAST